MVNSAKNKGKLMKNCKSNHVNNELKTIIDDDTISYAGYVFYSDGSMFNKHNNAIKVSSTTGNLRIIVENEPRVLNGGRFMYELFHNVVLSRSDMILYKDGDKSNVSLSNLELIKRKEYFKDKEWDRKFDKETQEKIKKDYKEGKAKGVTMYSLANIYDCCHITIWKIINDRY